MSGDTVTPESRLKEEFAIQSSLEKWQDQKFSMFIHWGIYSIPAGIWNGQQITGYSEQIKGHARIPNVQYAQLASQFNPMHWNADSVALLAKEAGMRSIVITSKHHDGFCMFGTRYSDFNVVDATSYKRDVIRELSDACKRHGLGFGVYFSLIDWHYPEALPFTSTRNSDSIPAAHHEYNLHQVEELLTNYGEISEIWFDMGSPTFNQSKEVAELVKRLQPDCMISGRLWNDQGDFVVMGDNRMPYFKMGVPWQTPASMFHETWSYRSWQERGDVKAKISEKIHDLLNVVSAGGNYLLNIGPTGDGTVIPFEKQVLQGMGKWLKENGEAVYGTHTVSHHKQDWGVITSAPGKIYLHVMDFPENTKLVVKGIRSEIQKIYPLSDPGQLLHAKKKNGDLIIEVPSSFPVDEYTTVIVLEHLDIESSVLWKVQGPRSDGAFVLTEKNAEKYHSYSGHDYYSQKSTIVRLKWNLVNEFNHNYKFEILVPSFIKGEQLNLVVNGETHIISIIEDEHASNCQSKVIVIEGIPLSTQEINLVELKKRNPGNPHEGFNAKGLKLTIKADDSFTK
ncbi:MAG: alpha-L-fucosidase [Bacteroidales bacterium]|nr:alpha-L-fucosidase [Bacteroidales bacterium]